MGAILLVVLLLLYLLSVYKRERVKKERRILLLQQQIQENENVLTTLQHDYIKRNKEIEDLSFRYAQNNESLSVENEVMRRHLLELQQKNKEENLKLADKNKILLDELKKYKDIKTESGRHYETVTFIIQLLDNPDTAHALTPKELDAIEYFVIRLFGPMFQKPCRGCGSECHRTEVVVLVTVGLSSCFNCHFSVHNSSICFKSQTQNEEKDTGIYGE